MLKMCVRSAASRAALLHGRSCHGVLRARLHTHLRTHTQCARTHRRDWRWVSCHPRHRLMAPPLLPAMARRPRRLQPPQPLLLWLLTLHRLLLLLLLVVVVLLLILWPLMLPALRRGRLQQQQQAMAGWTPSLKRSAVCRSSEGAVQKCGGRALLAWVSESSVGRHCCWAHQRQAGRGQVGRSCWLRRCMLGDADHGCRDYTEQARWQLRASGERGLPAAAPDLIVVMSKHMARWPGIAASREKSPGRTWSRVAAATRLDLWFRVAICAKRNTF